MDATIRPLTRADLDAAEALAALAFGRLDVWRSDITLYLDLEPSGCFIALLHDRIVGMGGAIRYGSFAWIGLMAVEPGLQGRGIGRAILNNILSWAESQECMTAVLDASVSGAPLYTHLGFVDDGSTVLFEQKTGGMQIKDNPAILPLGDGDLAAVAAFDRSVFGADRTRLLERLLGPTTDRAFLTRDTLGSVTGYVIAQPGRIGPWVAHTPDHAEALLRAALSLQYDVSPIVFVPSQNPAVDALLSRYGFAPLRALRHMRRGQEPVRGERSLIYGQGSFSLG